MNFKRIGRSLMCLLLVCCLLFNAFPQKADATSVGAAVITGAASVAVPALNVVGATLIALGLYVGVNGTDGIEAVAQSAVSHLETAGTYIKDGCVELLQTVNSAGEKAYYVAGEMMDDLRSWIYDANVFIDQRDSYPVGTKITLLNGDYLELNTPARLITFVRTSSYNYSSYDLYQWVVSLADSNLLYYLNGSAEQSQGVFISQDEIFYRVYKSKTTIYDSNIARLYTNLADFNSSASLGKAVAMALNAGFLGVYPLTDISLGSLPSQTTDLIDGTSARAWSEPMTNNGLYVAGGSNDPDPPDQNNGKWFWPLALTVIAADLWAMSQADEWSGKTPQEFDDYSTKTEFEILSRPEVEFGQGIEIAPVTSPSPDTGGGDPGTDPDQDGTEEIKTDYTTWFSKLYTSVENIAGKFDEIPNKFQSWISDLKTDIQTQTDKLAEHASNTLAAIQSLPESFAESFSANLFENLLSKLFAPAPDFIANKVETLKAKYPYLDTFLGLGTNLKGFFMNLGAKPPIIYIDLGSATGSYLFGGKTVFVDLTWYSQYKGLMDSIIGAFIWLWLAWRVFLSIPGIIQGEAGTWGQKQNDIGMGTTAPPIIFTQKTLPSGRHSRRSKE